MAGYPKDLYGHYLPLLIQKEYPSTCASRGIVYIDTWPLASPMLAVFPGLPTNSPPRIHAQSTNWFSMGFIS